MRNLKTSVSAITLAAILSTTLILGGCGEKNKGETVKIEEVASRNVEANEAEKALKLMALYESGMGDVAWTDRDGSGGNYTFYNFENDSNDGDKGIFASFELKGVHMEGEKPAFDQMIFNDFSGTDNDGSTITFENITLTEPSAALSDAITLSFNGDDDAFDNIEGDVNFKALSFSGLKVDDKDGVLTLGDLKIGKDKDETGYFILRDLDMDMLTDGEKTIMKLDSIDVTGVNISKYQGLISSAVDSDAEMDADKMKELMDSINAYDPDFKSFSLKNFNMDMDGLKVNLDSIKGKAEKKDGKLFMSHSMSPLSITPPKETKDQYMQMFAEELSAFGYDKLEFTMEQNSVLDEENDTMIFTDSYIQLKDGFKFSYDLDVSGYKAFTEQAVAAQSGGSLLNPFAAIGMASSIDISQIRLSLRDDSILERYFKMSAEQSNKTPEDIKNKIKNSLKKISMEAQDEAQQKFADDLKESVISFLDDGGTLVFEMTPSEPVNPGGVAMGAMFGSVPDITEMNITISKE